MLQSLIFGKRAHEPRNLDLGWYKDKKRALTNQFLSLVRVRNPTYLIHWAVVGTMSMNASGVKARTFRNPVLRSFSAHPRVAFRKLDEIYESTREIRTEFVQS